MEKNLNSLEKAILTEIIKANKEKYLYLEKHIPFLSVKSRENTGVGMYINFEDLFKNKMTDEKQAIFLSSNRRLELDSLKHGLIYELNILNGKFDFLELVTHGDESWDGKYKTFKFI